ncbi:hypothetical protein FHS22_004584 [Planomonospora venezuelensis]|uniref:Uncharacterized protein n=1 Tax=Planomonospora venezuelensis TaxID=1999 RepID=A0A841DD93_PLAVE|nr:hypothetical protein [Planomonospora venezuelensis]
MSWGRLGIGGRAAVLAGFTAVTLAVPKLLVRRGLAATAETVAVLGAALLLLDCYAARQAGPAGLGDLAGNDYAAGSLAAVALALAGYSRLVPLKLPLPVAIALAQFPLPLLAVDRTAAWVTAALAATAAADAALLVSTARRERRLPGVRGTAAVSFGTVWTAGVLVGLLDSGLVPDFSSGAWPSSLAGGALLAVLAVTGVAVALRAAAGVREILTAVSASALAAGAAAAVLPLVRPAWQVLPYTVAGLAVAAAALYLPGRAEPSVRSAGAFAGAAVAALTLLPSWDDITRTLSGPFARLDGIWSGAHGYGEEWSAASPAPVVVLGLLAAASAAAWRRAAPGAAHEGGGPVPEPAGSAADGHEPAAGVSGRTLSGAAALVLGTLGVALAPAALGWGLPGGLAALLVPAVALVAGAALTGAAGTGGLGRAGNRTAGTSSSGGFTAGGFTAGGFTAGGLAVTAGAVTLQAAVTALAERTATHVALTILALAWTAAACGGRTRTVRAAGAGIAALLAGGEVLAVEAELGLQPRYAAFGLLAAACLAAAVAGWRRGPYGLPAAREEGAGTGAGTGWRLRAADAATGLEAAGYLLAACGLALAVHGSLLPGVRDLPMISLACAVVGVLLAGTALRPDRRQAAYAGTGFLLAATWLRLLASDITVVEAYTAPFALVLLAFGWWRARGGASSSWAAYGSGLVSGLLPSVVALPGGGWTRPLLLGALALAVLLAGTRFRLQAPAVLGGLTLAAVALHELAPWIAQAVLAVPRWVPMALGGLLLVVVGATYEARLREVRRLRAAVGRMR